ncbi:MAG TPA: metal-dependent hydrolase [Mariprofundaceae bacterium]|nr:metal-dependent hydrolase [Mariprofundaceae bacterium]
MDPLTHAISGAALARALPRHRLPTAQWLLIVLLAMAPDADYVLHYFSDTLYLTHHRGITHSLLMLPLWTWLIASLMPRSRERYPVLPWLIGAALAMHILLDIATSFGTMILAPFSDWRASFDLVFIIDPIFTGLMLLPLLFGIFLKDRARLLGLLSLALMGFYLALTLASHHKALELARQQQPAALSVAALPLPFSPFHWQLIATYPGQYQRAAVNLLPGFTGTESLFPERFRKRFMPPLQSPDKLQWQELTSMSAVKLPAGMPGVAFYRWFARFPVLLERDATHIEFGDLRFGAGVPGEVASFRLRLELGEQPKAWLIWRDERKSPLD